MIVKDMEKDVQLDDITPLRGGSSSLRKLWAVIATVNPLYLRHLPRKRMESNY